ncbi:MAG TPA: sigma-54 dependent transcriptional regulator [Planctomycetota bacterium]|nr:sigma-54 dependent transcriptional regulator [Planctomycetota bacterium]
MPETVLVVDDHEATRASLREVLERQSLACVEAGSRHEAFEALRNQDFDLVITDLRLPDGDGFEVLLETKRLSPTTPVAVVTGYGNEQIAVDAIKKGAQDYLTKPIDLNRLRAVITSGLARRRLELENLDLQRRLGEKSGLAAIIGVSPAMQKIRDMIRQVGPTNATILITGENGSGKEVVAAALQALSDRARNAFIKVNMAGMPPTLIESELFGHERGAFTGAHRLRKGRFELADGGTLFLDEIGELPVEIQVKLLRVLQSREFERVGGSTTIKTDVRLICATNRNLDEAIKEGHFRSDLYYRINVIRIHVPPLRERPEDVPDLVQHFLTQFPTREGGVRQLTERAMSALRAYAWPGNVRELRNFVERICLFTPGSLIDWEHLPDEVRAQVGERPAAAGGAAGAPVTAISSGAPSVASPAPGGQPGPLVLPLDLDMNEVEKRYILAILTDCDWNKTHAAKRLKIGLKTLYRKISAYGLDGGVEASVPPETK